MVPSGRVPRLREQEEDQTLVAGEGESERTQGPVDGRQHDLLGPHDRRGRRHGLAHVGIPAVGPTGPGLVDRVERQGSARHRPEGYPTVGCGSPNRTGHDVGTDRDPDERVTSPCFPPDDLGRRLNLARPPTRIVSLVPSLTEALAATVPELLVGATDFCTHTGGLDPATGPRHEEPRPRRDRTAATGPRRRQPRGEPASGRGPAGGGRHPGVGDRDRLARRRRSHRFRRLFDDVLDVGVPAVGGGGRARVVAPARPAWGPCPGAHLARPVDGGRRRHVRRRPAPPARAGQRRSTVRPSAIRGGPWRS